MGEVYRARDTKLGRDVALKFLPEAFAQDAERMARFKREAQMLASLNHPNIAAIYGLEESGGVRALVMELVEGPTLADRLAVAAVSDRRRGSGAQRAPLQLDETLHIAKQIAEALEYAHERGVVHRDLKPANVKVTREGVVKVLDFGLAKAANETATPSDPSNSPTLTAQATQAGMIMGTAAYMAPEQARGHTVDRRADIWSFGVVLFEMLTGYRAFEGETTSDVLAAVLKFDPDWSALPASTPPPIVRLLHRCLTKDRKQRLQAIGEARIALEETLSGAEVAPAIDRRPESGELAALPESHLGRQWWLPWVVAFACATLAVAAITSLLAPVPQPRVLGSTQITRDGYAKVSPFNYQSLWTDGSRAYFNEEVNGAWRVAQVSAQGGETLSVPTSLSTPLLCSLDPSRSNLLIADLLSQEPIQPLWILPLLGGTARRLGNVRADDGVYSPDGQHVVFAQETEIYRTNLDGSETRKLATVPWVVIWPRFSPDGSLVRFSQWDWKSQVFSIWEMRVDGSGLHALLPNWNKPNNEVFGSWTPDGKYYIFQATRAGTANSNLWALSEKGNVFHRARRQPIQLTSGPLDFYMPVPSPDGKKVYAIGVQLRAELTRYDSKAQQSQPYLSSLWAEQLDFSRDGKWVTYVLYPEGTLWRSRLDGSERLQLTLPPAAALEPQWSPDGKRIVFLATTPGKPQNVFAVPAEGGAAEQLTAGDTPDFNPSWSADGQSMIYGQYPVWTAGKFSTRGIRVLDLKTRQVSTLPGSEGLWTPSPSRDGRYIAAITSDSKAIMLYNNGTRKWEELAKAVVNCIAWSHDSQYLYFDNYPNRDAAIYRVRISDHKLERLISLGGLRRAESANLSAPWMGLAPDDSLLLLRDTGTQEIYAFDVDFP